MKNISLSATALVVLIVAGAAWLVLNFEYVTEPEYVGLQGEARRNPLLAAMRLYERMGVPAREARRLADLDTLEPGATLILLRQRAALTQHHAEQILSWVAAGGQLIVEPQDYRLRDRLLDALKLHRRPLRLHPPRKPSEFRLPHAPEALRVDFGPRQHFIDIEKRAELTVDEHWSVLLQRFPLGRGHVTVVNGLRFMTNGRIGELDHAEFAWQLVRFAPATPAVVVTARLEMPSFANWVRESAWSAALTGALLMSLWLWRVVPRFGPLRADPPAARPRLLDHIRASGRFYWASGSARRLLSAAREACLRAIARNHPGLAAMAPPAQVARLAQLTSLPAPDLELALNDAPADAREFTTAIRTLQAIGDRLNRKVRT
jgi:hypothetical protein